jgi:hypothetical protein
MTFVQIIEMTTTKAPEIEELMDEWMAATEGGRSARRSLLAKDRERPDAYVQVVEFPSCAVRSRAVPRGSRMAHLARDDVLCRWPILAPVMNDRGR